MKAGTSLRDPAFLSQPSMPGGLPGAWPKLPLAVPNPFTWNQAWYPGPSLTQKPVDLGERGFVGFLTSNPACDQRGGGRGEAWGPRGGACGLGPPLG